METNLIFKKAAKMLLENGYRVLAWENDIYTPKWRKGDFVSLDFGKDGVNKIGHIGFDSLGGPIRFGFNYKPSKYNGSGCFVFEDSIINMENIEKLMNSPYPSFIKNVEEYRDFQEFAKRELDFYSFKHEVKMEELESIK